MRFLSNHKTKMPAPEDALPGRSSPCPCPRGTRCSARRSSRRSPRACERPCSAWAASGAPSGCSGRLAGVYTTAVGYAGGYTPNPTYEEVCSGRTGHTEVVLVVFDPAKSSPTRTLLKVFWEGHDPTQGMRQGNDVGTQYRSAIYTDGDAQRDGRRAPARGLRRRLAPTPATARSPPRSRRAGEFYYAEDYHQQYLAQEPERLLRPGRHRRDLPDRGREGRVGAARRRAPPEGARRRRC